MKKKDTIIGVFGLLILIAITSFVFLSKKAEAPVDLDPTPQNITLTGTFTCLPHLDTSTESKECTYGFETNDGVMYAVNFGQSAEAMDLFNKRSHITAEGFTVIKEALSTDQWMKYDMEGIFTITRILPETSGGANAKININAVCQGALAYMTFPVGSSSEIFVQECIEGKHPEVIEKFKADMNLGDGAQI